MRIVLKFGGTSLKDLARMRAAADKVRREVARGNQVVVTVSAMAGATDALIALAREAGGRCDGREYDAIVASGEQVSSGLMALCLQREGVPARSFQGWQIPVRTNGVHGRARIETIEIAALEDGLAEGIVPVVAGFQGLGPGGRISTLGRGGSDTTAVALAAALLAGRCDIYTDVDGVYTADPRIVEKARKIARITYEEMLELASLGAKVLQTRSVQLAMVHGVAVQVLSSFGDAIGSDLPGTVMCEENGGQEAEDMEKRVVSGVTYSRDDAKITVAGVADKPGIAASIFGPLADEDVNVDMIVQNVSEGGTTDITFTVPRNDVERVGEILEARRAAIGFQRIHTDADVVKVSVIGVGMRSHAGVAQQMFNALAERGINLQVISTSEIKISVLVGAEFTELALRALHAAYGLDSE